MNEKVYKKAEEADKKRSKGKAAVESGESSGEEVDNDGDGEFAELCARLEDKEKEAARNKELYLRARADLENYKVRAGKERVEYIRHANDKVIGEFLDILDNIERALDHSGGSDDVDSLRNGVRHTRDNMVSVLAALGLEPVNTVGETFDPNIHEAISHEEDDGSEPGTVIREFKKGYFLHDRLLRPATVSVSKAPSDSGDEEGE